MCAHHLAAYLLPNIALFSRQWIIIILSFIRMFSHQASDCRQDHKHVSIMAHVDMNMNIISRFRPDD